jgi:hypothetical protein
MYQHEDRRHRRSFQIWWGKYCDTTLRDGCWCEKFFWANTAFTMIPPQFPLIAVNLFIFYYCGTSTLAIEWVTLLFRIRKVPQSNLGQKSGDYEVFVVLPSPSRQIPGYYLKLSHDHLLSHSSQSLSPPSQRCGPDSIPGMCGWFFFSLLDKTILSHIFSEYFAFPCQCSFHQLFHNH